MKKLVSIMVVAMMILAMCVTTVYAADPTASIKIVPSASEVKAGGKISITFRARDLNLIDAQGLYTLSANIVYDTKVFEKLTSDNITAQNGWKVTNFTQDGQISLDRTNNYINEEHDIFTINLTAKSDVTSGSTNITLSSIKASTDKAAAVKIADTTFMLNTGVATTTLNPISTGSNTGTGTSTSTIAPITTGQSSNGTNTGTSSGTTTNQSAKSSTTTGTVNSQMPKTGSENFILPTMIGLAIGGIIGFIQYRRMKY